MVNSEYVECALLYNNRIRTAIDSQKKIREPEGGR